MPPLSPVMRARTDTSTSWLVRSLSQLCATVMMLLCVVVYAGDDTRVMLKSGKGSDYINANYVEVSMCIFRHDFVVSPSPPCMLENKLFASS